FMFLAMTAWGASWVNVKILGKYITADELIFYRYVITSITMIPVLLYFKFSFKIDFKTLLLSMLGGVIMIVYTKLFYWGTYYGTSGLGGAFVTTLIPIVTFVLLSLFFGKKVTRRDIFALFLGAVGVMTLLKIWNFDLTQILLIQNGYFVLAAFTWAFLTITSSKSTKIHPMVFSFYMYVFTLLIDSAFFLEFTSGDVFTFDWYFWINLFIISVVSTTFATSLFFVGIERLGTSQASSFTFLVPFSAIGLSAVFLNEPIYFTTIIGTVLTLIAVSMLNNIKLPFSLTKK
ncbi:MAG: DMT family transporter, partial [Campylobacterota bacterium]|nr:DMT family transporter [Campylobacterota bacterium]